MEETFAPIEAGIDKAVFQYMKTGEHRLSEVKVPETPMQTVRVGPVSKASAEKVESILENFAKQQK